jgi:hypothetical protein
MPKAIPPTQKEAQPPELSLRYTIMGQSKICEFPNEAVRAVPSQPDRCYSPLAFLQKCSPRLPLFSLMKQTTNPGDWPSTSSMGWVTAVFSSLPSEARNRPSRPHR